MARIQGVSNARAGIIARIAFWFTKRKLGKVVNPVRVHAHHTHLLQGYGAMEMAQEKACAFDPVLKNLAQLRVAKIIDCPF